MLNFDDANVVGVDNAVSHPDRNIDDDDTEFFRDDNYNVEGIEGASLHPPNVQDGWVDLADGVGVGVHPPAAVDHGPDVGDRRPLLICMLLGNRAVSQTPPLHSRIDG